MLERLNPLRRAGATTRVAPTYSLSTTRLAIVSAVILVILVSVPFWAGSDVLRTLVELMYLLALAQMWNLLAGYAGLVSVGQQAWIGLGGYALIVFADDVRISPFLAVIMGGVIAALCAIPAAALLFRLRGGYFAIGTWVVAEVFRLLIASNTTWLRGGSGRSLQAAGQIDPNLRQDLTYWLALAIGLGSIALVYVLMRSRTGLGLTAIRDSESAASSLGINTRRIKWLVYVIAAFGTGVTGGLIYLSLLRVTPDAAFSSQWTAFMIFIVVIGGIGTIEGPILGTLIFFVLREYLSDFGGWSLILLGLVAVLVMLFAPEGLWGILQKRLNLEIFPVRRRLLHDSVQHNQDQDQAV
jgi:branched-chain amino acid transport system permease protein